jgi:hypothetical protein
MAVILQDPTRPRDPTSRHAFPDVEAEAKLSAPRTLAEELLAGFRAGGAVTETSFELASHGGYARSVTGTVAYLDEQAQTFMVRVHDGRLTRVPLRDVTSAHGGALSEHDELRSGRDVEGLGTAARPA